MLPKPSIDAMPPELDFVDSAGTADAAALLLLAPGSPVVRAWNAAARSRASAGRARGTLPLVPIGLGLVVLDVVGEAIERALP